MNAFPPPARQRWSAIIRQQRRSGMSISEFCRRNAIAISSFYAWRRKLADSSANARFVEVDVQPHPASLPSPLGAGGIELRLGAGRSLVLHRGFDRKLLVEIVSLLECLPAGPGHATGGVA